MDIERCVAETTAHWIEMRHALWPDADKETLVREAAGILAQPDKLVLIARAAGEVVGFIEAAIRHDCVNGCETSPVAFVEGLFVLPPWRRAGVARALVAAVESWARDHGLGELASDTLLENEPSHAMHRALGFSETERVVYFRKPL